MHQQGNLQARLSVLPHGAGQHQAIAAASPSHPFARPRGVIMRVDHPRLRARVVALAKEVLGERERKVFLLRCLAPRDHSMDRDSLAQELGVVRERIYRLEASARRKIVTALKHDGLLVRESSSPRGKATRRLRYATAAPV